MRTAIYRIGRWLLGQSVRLYYRRVEVVGREHIPSGGAAIVVANHPNSVADAFLLGSQLTGRRVYFIAKDAITRAPIIGPLVRTFGVVGVARGIDYQRQRELARQRNAAAESTCVPILLDGHLLAIFGEGISTDARRVHVIRKGAMRFGYAAEREADFTLGLRWIPVGITYSAKQRFRSDVLIRIGHPFTLVDLHAAPADHEAAVLQIGTERLQRALEDLVVNIERDELSGLVDRLADIHGSTARTLAARVERHQRIARVVHYFNIAEPRRVLDLDARLTSYAQRLEAAGLSDEVVRQRRPQLAVWRNLAAIMRHGPVVLLATYGALNSFVPRWTATVAMSLTGLFPDRATAAATGAPVGLTKRALFATLGGWIGVAIAFPLQAYVVYQLALGAWGPLIAAPLAVLYGLTLIPSWRWYVQARDDLRDRIVELRDALRFLRRMGPATRLQFRRRQLAARIRALLAAYDQQAPGMSV